MIMIFIKILSSYNGHKGHKIFDNFDNISII